jgi:hypothetical protein
MSSRRARADASAALASGRTTPFWVTVLYLETRPMKRPVRGDKRTPRHLAVMTDAGVPHRLLASFSPAVTASTSSGRQMRHLADGILFHSHSHCEPAARLSPAGRAAGKQKRGARGRTVVPRQGANWRGQAVAPDGAFMGLLACTGPVPPAERVRIRRNWRGALREAFSDREAASLAK